MIQSKQNPDKDGSPKLNSRLPVVAILMIIQVLFNSPDIKHPEFDPLGFVCGFEMLLEIVNSSIVPKPFGSTENEELVQIFIAAEQSEEVICPNVTIILNEKIKNNIDL